MSTPGNKAFGTTIKDIDLTKSFLSGPGQDLVPKTLLQLSMTKGGVDANGNVRYPFQDLFGPYKCDAFGNKTTDQQRWADYQRMDWSIRQLPAINLFESQTESKQSENAYVTGTLQMQIFWPPNFRRGDLARVPAVFRSAIENFFASQYVRDMLDELYFIERNPKVYGLNEFGKVLTWSPNVEGVVESEMVPVTIVDIAYRIDLRAWYRALEFMGRTKDDPFEVTLADLSRIAGNYTGIDDVVTQDPKIEIPDGINVTNP